MFRCLMIAVLLTGCGLGGAVEGAQLACGDYGIVGEWSVTSLDPALRAVAVEESTIADGWSPDARLLDRGPRISGDSGGILDASRSRVEEPSSHCWMDAEGVPGPAGAHADDADLEIADLSVRTLSGDTVIDPGDLIEVSVVLVNRGDETWEPARHQGDSTLPAMPAVRLSVGGADNMQVAATGVDGASVTLGAEGCSTVNAVEAGGVHTLRFTLQVADDASVGDGAQIRLVADSVHPLRPSQVALHIGQDLAPVQGPDF